MLKKKGADGKPTFVSVKMNPDIACDSTDHSTTKALSIMFVILYNALFMCYVIYMIATAEHNYQNLCFRVRGRFLFYRYKLFYFFSF